MTLFREEYSTIQDSYLRVDPSREESDTDELEYSNDDIGENTEVTPLGDDVKQEELENKFVGPGDDDDFDDDELDSDTEVDVEEDDDDFVDLSPSIDPDDDDFEDDDDDLLDDDELDTPLVAPDLDDDDLLDDEDDLLDDDDDFDDDDELTARTSVDTTADFSSRPHGRTTGTMLDHEPGLPG